MNATIATDITCSAPDPNNGLVARLVAQESGALEDFEREYHDSTYGLARRITGNERDAEEIAQNVLWTVYRKADSYRGDSHFQRWVNRITQNARGTALCQHDTSTATKKVAEGAPALRGQRPDESRPDAVVSLRSTFTGVL